ncbi:MAG: type III-A CRISPR-associated protein Cas10/Csm1, partial [Campylobacterales bacterium]
MGRYGEYFTGDFKHLEGRQFKRPALEDKNLLIAGDFFGIQKFIFERLSATKASKVVRAKSAFVQLFTLTLARYVCRELKINESHIVSSNAGKFEILSPNRDSSVLKEVQSTVDRYFIENFYGLSGVSICYVEFDKNELGSADRYKLLRKKLSDIVEESKYNKFNLTSKEPVLEYHSDISNETLCKICNIRKKEGEFCSICSMFEKLGRWLADEKNNKKISSKKDLLIELGDFETELTIDDNIRSYIKYSYDEEIKQTVPSSFSELAEESEGVKALAIIKADVDGMGDFLRDSNITDSPESFDMFSKTLDNFFSKHIPSIMRNKYPDSYTVFTGGDDLFLLGRWDSLLELAREIRDEFKKFIKTDKLTISFGI